MSSLDSLSTIASQCAPWTHTKMGQGYQGSCFLGLTEKIAKLCAHSFSEFVAGNKNSSLLQAAVQQGRQNCVDALLTAENAQSLLDLLGSNEQVPGIGNLIHVAIQNNQCAMLEHLFTEHWDHFKPQFISEDGEARHVSPIDELNDQGETPLMMAARLGSTRIIRLLQKKGANFEKENALGQRAIHFAAKANKTHAIDLLSYYDAKLAVKDKNRNVPMDYLAEALKVSKNELHPLLNRLDQLIDQQQNHLDRSLTTPYWLSHPPENLVFKGGGPKGIAYMGALNVLEENGLLAQLKRVAGTSAGSIQSALMAVGYKSEEMIAAFNTIDPREFMDDPAIRALERVLIEKGAINKALRAVSESYELAGIPGVIFGLLKALDLLKEFVRLSILQQKFPNDPTIVLQVAASDRELRLALKYLYPTGICKGDVFREWLDDKITEKAASALGKTKEDLRYLTFGELRRNFIDRGVPGFRHLYVAATDIQAATTVIINSEEEKWDCVIISDAIRASMSIPGLFKVHTLHELPPGIELGTFDATLRKNRIPAPQFGEFADGGIHANYPVYLFDSKKHLSTANQDPNTKLDPGKESITNPRTLGLVNYWADGKAPYDKPVETVGELISALANVFSKGEDYHLSRNPANKERTIAINNLGVSLFDFGTDPLPLLKAGELNTTSALQHFKGKIDQQSSYSLTASGIKLPVVYPGVLRQHAENLEHLHQKLLQPPGPTSSPKITVWSSGTEKRELTVSFINRFADEFSKILWLTPENISETYKSLALDMQIELQPGATFDSLRSLVHTSLEVHKEKKPYLLILENFDETPALPQGVNGRFLVLKDEKPTHEDEANVLHPPFLTDEEKEFLRENYFKEIFMRLHNPNCEKPKCYDLDEKQLHPRELEAITAINSDYRWISPPGFKDSQEYLRLRADDPKPKSLFLSTNHVVGRLESSPPAAYVDVSLPGAVDLRTLSKKTDFKYKVLTSYKEICHEIKSASKIGNISDLYIQADKGSLLRFAERQGHPVPDKSNPFSECYLDVYSGKKIKPIWVG